MILREAATRRNRALRKIRTCRSIPLETRAVLEAIIDLVDRPSGYSVAWPTARTIGSRIGRSERTVRWHLRAIRRTGIFRVHYLKPEEAAEWCQCAYGFRPKLDRVRLQAPPIYEINREHWLWQTATRVTAEQQEELGQVVHRVLALRNRSKLSRSKAPVIRGRASNAPVGRESPDLEGIRKNLLLKRLAPDSVIDLPLEGEDFWDVMEVEGLEPPVVDDREWDVVEVSQGNDF